MRVDDAADGEQSQRVGELEGDDDIAVLHFVPADTGLQQRREEAEDLAVHVVDGVGDEEQRADAPAVVGHPESIRIANFGFQWSDGGLG